jgi:L-fucose mutarotase
LLNSFPRILTPELLKILMEMRYGDEIVVASRNFPAVSIRQKLIRLDGHNVPEVLEVLLRFFPLDVYVEKPVGLMTVTHGDTTKPVIWEENKKIILESREPFSEFEYIEKFAFYERVRKAYAIIVTSESAMYANIILKKGVEI